MIYAKPGESAQQFGGTCHDGWVQMQGERPEGNYVASEDGQWIIKQQTKNELLAVELEKYNIDLQTLRNQITTIDLNGGSDMELKKDRVRASMATRKAAYIASINSIKNG